MAEDADRGEKRLPARRGGKRLSFLLWAVRLAPLGAVAWVWVRYGHILREMTVEDILAYEPENLLLAAAGLLGLYVVKSVTVVFPLIVLYISAGVLFSPPWAVLLNLLGLALAVTVPYGLGKFYGREYVERLVSRYKKGNLLRELQGESGFFLSYFTRIINLLPGDLVSMLLGAMNIGYGRYFCGSLLGLSPTMLAATFMGISITAPSSPGFIFSCAITVVLSAASAVLHRLRRNKQKNQHP